jgi:hypothetical protein
MSGSVLSARTRRADGERVLQNREGANDKKEPLRSRHPLRGTRRSYNGAWWP